MAAGILLLGTCVLTATNAVGGRPAPAGADGPAPCTTGAPPFPFAGFCATYSGANTWYGSYGPGFPTAQGWGFCADPPASGGDYPAPGYDYTAGGAPPGADTAYDNALGFAFGQAQAAGWWGGQTGRFTADQAAAAGKILYDAVVWGSPVPAMDPGTLAAYDDIDNWFNQAVGTTGTPVMTTGIAGGGASFTTSAFFEVNVRFPGSGTGLDGLGVLLSITGGTFDGAGGPTSIGVSTGPGGSAMVPIFASGTGTVTVDVSTVTEVGQVGLGFYHPTTGELSAQILAGFPAPVELESSQVLTAQVSPPEGTLSVRKAGDDTAYYGIAGAQFQVINGSGGVVDTLTTGSDGSTPATPEIPVGPYTVHEVSAPYGYQRAPDQSADVQEGSNTLVSFTGATEEHAVPATVTIAKVDAQTGQPLAGAVFDVRYDANNDGTFDEDLGTCTTGTDGRCSPGGNDGAALLPGDYEIVEVSAPSGYWRNPATDTQRIALAPGEAGSLTFGDYRLGSLQIDKSGNDSAYASVAGATFSISGPAPSDAVVGSLTVGPDGHSGTLAGLDPGTYTVTETEPPAGYQPVAPVTVAIAASDVTTVVDVLDHVQPASLTIVKVDRQTGAPLSGAVLDIRYDPDHSGTYSEDLGTCTTTAAGTCRPEGNDGSTGLLPGDYQVREVTPPPGYYPDPSTAVQDVTLSPGEVGTVTFSDPLLVAASFHKVATGNVDPAQVVYAGAVIDVTAGSSAGGVLATCTTGGSGTCTTTPVLVAGTRYCWSEPVAPPGLEPGAGGCFVADNDLATQPITVSDPGEFVQVEAQKVDAAAPTVGVAGAVLDLYRVDAGQGPDHPEPPPGAPVVAGETWVAQATSGSTGVATFPLQFPGYAYCVVEQQAPADYVLDQTPRCSGVLTGSTTSPPSLTIVTTEDAEATVTLEAYKYNSLTPGTGIPGATYDLYVEGGPPPGGVPTPAPADALPLAGDTWYARGATGASGRLAFTVPAGRAWCLREVNAPTDYELDPALHCTGVLSTTSPPAATTVALPETRATVYLTAYKFDSLAPGTVIADATYELLVRGAVPAGSTHPEPAAGTPVPEGDHFWAEGTTDGAGVLSFAVPAGYSWCLRELHAPPGYQPDPGYHCTGTVTNETPASAATVALPEVPIHEALAFTGWSGLWSVPVSAALIVGGGGLWRIGSGGGGGGGRGGGSEPPDDPPDSAVGGGVTPRTRMRRRRGGSHGARGRRVARLLVLAASVTSAALTTLSVRPADASPGANRTSSAPGCTPTVTASGGTPQQALIGNPFPSPLQATVDCGGQPGEGDMVTFELPASGAGGTFADGSLSTAVPTDSDGVATSPPVIANGVAGGWQAAASASSEPVVAEAVPMAETVTYQLTNVAPAPPTPPPPNPPPAAPHPAPRPAPVPSPPSPAPPSTPTTTPVPAPTPVATVAQGDVPTVSTPAPPAPPVAISAPAATLAFTGAPDADLAGGGILSTAAGGLLLMLARLRGHRRLRRGRR